MRWFCLYFTILFFFLGKGPLYLRVLWFLLFFLVYLPKKTKQTHNLLSSNTFAFVHFSLSSACVHKLATDASSDTGTHGVASRMKTVLVIVAVSLFVGWVTFMVWGQAQETRAIEADVVRLLLS